MRIASLVGLILILSGCVAQDQNNGRKITVNGNDYWFASASATSSCTELVQGWLFDSTGKQLLDKAHAGGASLPCAMLAGSIGAAAVGVGLYNGGDNSTVSSSSTSGASATQVGHGFHREHYKPAKKGHGERD